MPTPKQIAAYEFIADYIKQHDHAPTVATIAAGLGLRSRGSTYRLLKELAQANWIRLHPGKRHNIELCKDTKLGLPIVGKIAAGSPIEILADDQFLNIERDVLGDERFLLRVDGNSMLGDNICDGDYIICERKTNVLAGRIAVILIDNQETTLKRVRYNADGSVTLLPSNPEYLPQTFGKERVSVQGLYVGLLRLD